ncbi:MAG: hypothetical protein ACM3ZE_15785 [Myxococcales bacterium]
MNARFGEVWPSARYERGAPRAVVCAQESAYFVHEPPINGKVGLVLGVVAQRRPGKLARLLNPPSTTEFLGAASHEIAPKA